MPKKSLIIVESPTKIKTLRQILGAKYLFESSYGHIRDLPESEFGIDLEKDFEPKYVPMKEKSDVIHRLQAAANECDTIYLCPDPDREGEAIAWHISELIGQEKKIQRVTFQSITKDAVEQALKAPRAVDLALVNAQQARRLLDRIVGYSISPLLNRRLRRGRGDSVSAGRVQSVALKLVVDREKEILAFIPREYWNIEALLFPKKREQQQQSAFSAFLQSIDGKRVEKEIPIGKEASICTISSQKEADAFFTDIQRQIFTLFSIDRKDRKRQPEAPFTTSTLQQEASRHFRFSPSKTMEVAQDLYEGREIGDKGAVGLITYMRTDSVRVAPEALFELRSYIQKEYGNEFLYTSVRNFQVKKSAQDAHEAIRPADITLTPESIKGYLTHDQLSLYTLIWKRYIASQMSNAVYDTLTYDIKAGERYLFRATGSRLKFPGFLSVYEEKQDEEEAVEPSQEKKESFILLPEVNTGETLDLDELQNIQSFTRPPPRFTEATLVKELEKSGIGRPSTYASIMKKILAREYTEKEQGRLKPTDLGSLVTEMLQSHFQSIMDTTFTASMENSLEEIAENKLNWKTLLQEFWTPFSESLKAAQETFIPPKVTTDIPCPKCSAPLQKIWFKSKYFLGCSRYPECDFSGSLEEQQFDKTLYNENFDWNQHCPKCQSEMKVRFGKFGPFLGCSHYPECRGIINIPKKGESSSVDSGIEIPCPAVGCDGKLTQKRSRFGKLFWSCSSFPECDVIGDSVEIIQEKFHGRVKSAYIKAERSKKNSSKKDPKKKSSKSVSSETKTKKKKSPQALPEELSEEPKKRKRVKKENLTESSTEKVLQAKKSVRKKKE